MTSNNEKSFLLQRILQKALQITEWFKDQNFKSYLKQDKSPVTLADYASQIYIISKLRKYFPDDSIIAEEKYIDTFDPDAEKLIKKCFKSLNIDLNLDFKDIINYSGVVSDYQWTIDPIDGTLGYQQGLSYAIGIGYMKSSDLLFSAIGVPHYNELGNAFFIAEKGCGAKISYGDKRFNSISVSKKDNLQQARICISLHYNKPWVFDFVKEAGITNSLQIDSMLKFCMIADGSADLYIKPMNMHNSFSWDYLPGTLLVKEAGGKVSDFNKKDVEFVYERCVITSPGIISSNGLLHNNALNLLKQIKVS